MHNQTIGVMLAVPAILRVPPAPAPYLSKARLQHRCRLSAGKTNRCELGTLPRGLGRMRLTTHAEVVICTPNLNFLFDFGSVSNWELVGKAVDIVKVAVRFVIVLFLKLGTAEALMIKPTWAKRLDFLSRHHSGRFSSLVERAAGSYGTADWAATVAARVSYRTFFHSPLRLRQIPQAMRAFVTNGRNACGAFFNACTTHGRAGTGENTVRVMDIMNVGNACETSIAGDDLGGTGRECWAHNGAFRSPFSEKGYRRVPWGRRSAKSAQGRSFSPCKERTRGFEAG